MAEFEHSTTRTADALALWTYQYRGKTTIDALTALFSDESQRIETAARDVRDGYLLASAVGTQLDALGAIVGQPREGRTDSVYRAWIRARIRVNRSSGSAPDLYAVAQLILGTDLPLYLWSVPVGVILQAGARVTDVPPRDVLEILQETASVSVPVYWQYPDFPDSDEIFTFAPTDTVVASSPNGFNGGRLSDMIGAESPDPPVDWIESILGDSIVLDVNADDLDLDDGDTVTTLAELTAAGDPLIYSALEYRGQRSAITGTGDARLESTNQDLLDVFEGGGSFAVAWYGSPKELLSTFETLLYVDDGAAGEYVWVSFTSAEELLCVLVDGGGTSFAASAVIPDADPRAWVVSYDAMSSTITLLANEILTTTSVTPRTPTGLTQFQLLSSDDALPGADTWGTFSRALLFDRALTDTEIAQVSSHLRRTYAHEYGV